MTRVTQIPITIDLPPGAPVCCCGGGACRPDRLWVQGLYYFNVIDGPGRELPLIGGVYRQIPGAPGCTDWRWGMGPPGGSPLTEPSLDVTVTPADNFCDWRVDMTGGHDCCCDGYGHPYYVHAGCANLYPWPLGNSLSITEWESCPTACLAMVIWVSPIFEFPLHDPLNPTATGRWRFIMQLRSI